MVRLLDVKYYILILFSFFIFFQNISEIFSQNIVPQDYEYQDPFIETLEGKPIGAIKYKGLNDRNKSIVDSTINYLGSPGELFNYDKLKQVFRDLYHLGYFEDIKVDGVLSKGSVILTFIFTELPEIEEIYFEGLDELDSDDLLEKMTMQPEKNFKALYVEQDIQAIIDLYKDNGIIGTKVDIELRKSSRDKILVYVKVEEGEEIYIEEINVEGCRQLEPDDILDAMETQARTFYKSDAVLDSLKLEQDMERIILYCKENGFYRAKVTKPDVRIKYVYPDESEDYPDKGYYITVKIEEGDQYFMGKIKVKGNTIFPSEKLLEYFEQEEGEIYNHTKFLAGIAKIKMLYQNRGYANANITFLESINESTKIINFTLNIYESQKVHIENIYITNNDKTKTYVIDRELKITEGSPLNFQLIRESMRRLINTGYFKNIFPDTRQSSEEGLIDLVFRVQEQRTGIFTMGAGYGSASGFTIFEEVRETNFLGYGWSLSERIDYGERSQNYQLAAETDWLFPYSPIYFRVALAYQINEYVLSYRDLQGGVRLGDSSLENRDLNGDGVYDERDLIIGRGFETTTDGDAPLPDVPSIGLPMDSSLGYLTYLTRGFSFSLSGGYRFWDYWNFLVRDKVFYFITEEIKSGSVILNDQDVERILSEDSIVKNDLSAGWQLQNSILFGLAYDRRDYRLNTTKGFRVSHYFDFTGGFVGDKDHIRLESKFSAYYSPLRRESGEPWFVFAIYANAEVLYPQFNDENKRIDIDEIYSGEILWFDGVNELRGWTTLSRNELRGFSKGSYSGEMRVPIPGINQIVSGVFFFDAGNIINNPKGGYGNLPIPFLQHFYETPIYNQKTGKKLPYTETYTHLGREGEVGFKYSWGFGIRIEIPMLPIRLYFAQKGRQLTDDGGHWVQWDKGFETVLSVAGKY